MRMGYLVIAVFLTVLDGVVTVDRGWPVWVAWSGDIVARVFLVMMAVLAATALANVWAHAIARLRHGLETQKPAYDANFVVPPIDLQGERHV